MPSRVSGPTADAESPTHCGSRLPPADFDCITIPSGSFETYVRDLAGATVFYETVLGRTLHQLPAELRVFVIGGGSSPRVNPDDPNGFMYLFNKTTWPTTPVIHPRLNSVEEWRFINTNNDQHPIHVHVNDFQVMNTIDPVTGVNSGAQPHAYDNFNVPAPQLDSEDAATTPGEMTIRSLFQDFTGTFVMHCHRLDHEDNGLMMTINVIPEVSTYAIATQQGQAPAVVEVRDQANNAVVGRVTPFPNSRGLPNVLAGCGQRPARARTVDIVDGVGNKAQRQAARQAVADYHQARLGELIDHVATAIDRHRAGEIDAYAVDETLHHYYRAARNLWKFCWSGGSGTQIEMIAHILDQMTADGELIDWWGRASTRPRRGEPSKGLQSDHQPSD